VRVRPGGSPVSGVELRRLARGEDQAASDVAAAGDPPTLAHGLVDARRAEHFHWQLRGGKTGGRFEEGSRRTTNIKVSKTSKETRR